jgi:23S rRNA (cytidine1920-2'-O)/16S rRNA (cytidine1409-2'-O)-methyltransferase
VPSRARAVEAIDAGRVLVAGGPVRTAARQVGDDEAVVVLAADHDAYVSRGGHKLAAGLDAFVLDVGGRIAVDVGASTGGFTDCLLQRGATHVHAIDVGRGQLAWTLREDSRVTVMERTNVRDLGTGALDPVPSLCVADVSFISLRTIAPSLLAICAPAADHVLLVKPQFEVGRARLPRGGVVRDAAVHRDVLTEVVADLERSGLGVRAVVPSPLRGADGNVEFLAHASAERATVEPAALDLAVSQAHEVSP